MIDRVTSRLDRPLYEVPVGFKWFVAGLLNGDLSFGGEESAGASFSRIDGRVWTTDKGRPRAGAFPPAEIARYWVEDHVAKQYRTLTQELGEVFANRVDAPATAEQKKRLSKLDGQQVRTHH